MKKTRLWRIVLPFMLLILVSAGFYFFYERDFEDTVYFQDAQFEEIIRKELQIKAGESLDTAAFREVIQLDLSDQDIHNLQGIEYFTNLQELNISGNQVDNLEPLSKLRSLTILDVSNNDLQNVNGLAAMPSLEQLFIHNNNIKTIEPLRELGHLRILNMEKNNINSIAPLTNSAYLEEIYMNDNQVRSIESITTMGELNTLDASYNLIEDISSLEQSQKLKDLLYLEGNPILEYDPLLAFYSSVKETDLGELEYLLAVSERGGMKKNGVEVTIQPALETDDVNIHYTLDGSEPNEGSPVYSEAVNLETSGVLSAKAISENGTEGKEVRESYIINESHEMPVVSLSTDPDNLYDEEIGIYVSGVNDNPRSDALGNYAMRGREWERESKIEFFEEDGRKMISQNIGLRIHGGFSRTNEQKSLRVYTRNEYGNNSINYPIFGENGPGQFHQFILRNSGNDYDSTMLRDAYLQESIQGEMNNLETQLYKPVVVYMNGEYWGIHNIRERFDSDYFSTAKNIDSEGLDLLENEGSIVEGNSHSWDNLIQFVEDNDLSNKKMYDHVTENIDIDNYIDYNITEIFVRNTDWPRNNYQFYRDRGGDGKWRWIIYDLDVGYGRYGGEQSYAHHTLATASGSGFDTQDMPDWSTELFSSLMENKEFKQKFINRFTVRMDTVFEVDRMKSRLEKTSEKIESEIPRHLNRWGSIPSIDSWKENIQVMNKFSEQRPEYVRSHLAQQFDLKGRGEAVVSEGLAESLQIEGVSLCLSAEGCFSTLHLMTDTRIPLTLDSYEEFELETSDEKVVEVFNDQSIKLNEPGEAVIKAIDSNGSVLGDIQINVSHYEKETVEIIVGETVDLDGSDWVSSDESILSLEAGSVTAKASGKAMLTKRNTDLVTEIKEVTINEQPGSGEE